MKYFLKGDAQSRQERKNAVIRGSMRRRLNEDRLMFT